MARAASRQLERYRQAVILRDGSTLCLRPIEPGDFERVQSLFYRMSPHSIYLRYHHVVTHMSQEEAKRYSTVDYHDTFALVGIVGSGEEERIVAVGRYAQLPREHAAEVAFEVEDAYQGKGIGTHLLEQLAAIARENGFRTFEAEVLAENEDMMRVFSDSGFQVVRELEGGINQVVLPLTLTPAFEERSAERERTAAIASLRAFLNPRSIAVIGASQREGTAGNMLFRNLLREGFTGAVYPINPKTEVVASIRTYPTVLDVPHEVDMAIIAVPATAVNQVVEQCGRKGVRGAVVISAGFGESGDDGAAMEHKVLETARSYGMRLVGPNCFGIINTSPQISMNATFSALFPPRGRVGLCTQSGALGIAILEYAQGMDIGLSTFVSIGNRADVSSNDLLQYWYEDPDTDVILLYLESFGNPRRFSRIARTVAESKPVVAIKSGRTPAGSRAAASHTGALASADVASDALFKQAGMIRVDTMEELFDIANLLSHQPLPRGRRVVILTNGGGPAILTADACAARGLEVPPLSEKTHSQLKGLLPPNAGLANPIDMTADASVEQYRKAMETLAQDEDTDIVIVIFIPIFAPVDAVADCVREMAPLFREQGKTLLASFISARKTCIQADSDETYSVPCFTFPESAAASLSRACEYSEWLERPKGRTTSLKGISRKKAEQLVTQALERSPARPLWLDGQSVNQLLECYGIVTAPVRYAATAAEAMKAARKVGFPVAVKLLSDTIVHKTEVGGVVLNLVSGRKVEQAFTQIEERLVGMGRRDEMQGVTVQRMVPGGVEVIVGVTQDPSFGPLTLFGAGGIHAELFKDVTFRIHPLTNVDAREMVRAVKVYQLLAGWRGAEPSDIEAVEELLLRVSAMEEDLPQIAELDLNPVKVLGRASGYVVVDARVMLA